MQPLHGSLSLAHPVARLVPLGQARVGPPRARRRSTQAFRNPQRAACPRARRAAARDSFAHCAAHANDQPRRSAGGHCSGNSQAARETPMKRDAIAELFHRLRELDPNPTTELKYNTPFELLVAVILSAQATDAGVNKATRRLFPVANTPKKILALGEDGLKKYISTIGLYNAKAKNIIATCGLLLERHGGEVPCTREELEALPGVGRKTANVVLNTVFGEAAIAVDTHIFRVCNRTGLARGATVRQVEDKLMKVVPDEYKLGADHWLILHGRYVCVARKPKCPVCPIRDLCAYKHKTPVDRAGTPGAR